MKLFKKKVDQEAEEKAWTMTPKLARKMAAGIVKSAAALGVTLDYSAKSLADVDMLIDKERETKVGLTPEMHIVLRSLGAYAGEVLAKNLGGRWIETFGDPRQDPLVMVVGSKYAINIVSIAYRRFLSGDPISLAKTYEETAKLKEGEE